VLEDSFQKYAAKFRQREELDAELLKLRQLINATANMLPDDEKADYESQLAALAAQMTGLTEAVRDALKLATADGSYATATQIRDHLVKAGFDFTRYSSNPLASVNTALRRFKPEEVEPGQTESGVTTYRWKLPGFGLDPYTTAGQAVIRARMSAGKPFTTAELRDLTKAKKR
jgi:hypothetical protein